MSTKSVSLIHTFEIKSVNKFHSTDAKMVVNVKITTEDSNATAHQDILEQDVKFVTHAHRTHA
jgi:hypothetical protein